MDGVSFATETQCLRCCGIGYGHGALLSQLAGTCASRLADNRSWQSAAHNLTLAQLDRAADPIGLRGRRSVDRSSRWTASHGRGVVRHWARSTMRSRAASLRGLRASAPPRRRAGKLILHWKGLGLRGGGSSAWPRIRRRLLDDGRRRLHIVGGALEPVLPVKPGSWGGAGVRGFPAWQAEWTWNVVIDLGDPADADCAIAQHEKTEARRRLFSVVRGIWVGGGGAWRTLADRRGGYGVMALLLRRFGVRHLHRLRIREPWDGETQSTPLGGLAHLARGRLRRAGPASRLPGRSLAVPAPGAWSRSSD